MDKLPQDPAILVSAVNMLLRDDEFDDLDTLCSHYDTDTVTLQRKLLLEGYTYSRQQRQIRPLWYDSAPGTDKDTLEVTHSLFHQKNNILKTSKIEQQKDDIYCAISAYAQNMPRALYQILACGKEDFLQSHDTFADDLKYATEALEKITQAK